MGWEILMGGYSGLEWSHGKLPTTSGKTAQMFTDLLCSVGLMQPTYPRSGNTLGLIHLSHTILGVLIYQLLFQDLTIAQQAVTMFLTTLFLTISLSHVPHRKACQRDHYVPMCQVLQLIDVDLEHAHLNVDESYDYLASTISELTDLHVPIQQPKSDTPPPPWKVRPPHLLFVEARQLGKLTRV